MRTWKAWGNKIFGVSANEFSGFKWLIFTALFCTVALMLIDKFTYSPYLNYGQDKAKLDSLLIIMKAAERPRSVHQKAKQLDYFDPNIATNEKLLALGFPAWLATRLINYRSTGATFYRSKDLLKIYNFPDSLYLHVEPYVRISSINKSKARKNIAKSLPNKITNKRVKPSHKAVEYDVFDLNKADTAMLQMVKGIGSKLSKRIVAYRSSLGGYTSITQLYEIYKLDSTVIEKLLDISEIKENFVPVKLNVNLASKQELARHPYINWSQAKLIVAYRKQHGKFRDFKDLQKVYSINKNWAKKNAPYLTF